MSLIELVISISIISILTVAGVISLSKTKTYQNVDIATGELKVTIIKAKNYAQNPPEKYQGLDYKQYGVKIDKTNNKYWLVAKKSDGGNTDLIEYNLPDKVIFGNINLKKNTAVLSEIIFDIESRAKITNLGEDGTIEIKNNVDTKTIIIKYPYGSVEAR